METDTTDPDAARARARRTRLGPRVSQSHGGRPRRRRSRPARSLGEGWHEGPGTAHAEVMALAAAGDRSRGATVVCTLEPCNHFGRTPPCTRALIDAGVARVVVAATDPNLGDDTPGLAELRAAGIEVEHGRAGRRVAAPEPGVRTSRHDRPSARHAEDGVEPRRQDGGDRRFLPMDHRPRRRAPTCSGSAPGPTPSSWARGRRSPTIPSLTVRDARFADVRAADAGRGRHRGSCAGHRPSVRRVGTDNGRHVRPHRRGSDPRSGTLREPTSRSWSATPPARCRWPRCCEHLGQARRPGGARRRGRDPRVELGSGRPDRRRRALRRARSSSGVPPLRAWSAGAGFAPIAEALELIVRLGRADRPRHPAGGPCSPGSLRSAARCAR